MGLPMRLRERAGRALPPPSVGANKILRMFPEGRGSTPGQRKRGAWALCQLYLGGEAHLADVVSDVTTLQRSEEFGVARLWRPRHHRM